jgi:iron-sulfur cluster assembly protein
VFTGAEDARVFVDPKSFRLLDGVVLDFDTNPVGRGFMFQNPNAKSTCGCGTSFSV